MKVNKAIIAFFLFCLALSQITHSKPVVTSTLSGESVAIQGYDSVGYFTQDQAMKGSEKYSVKYLGVDWWFANAEHQALFKKNPEKYAPQFNGHCANGLSDQHQVPGNPEIYRIIDEKLYFFYSKWGRLQWKFNQQEQIVLANDFWEFNNKE